MKNMSPRALKQAAVLALSVFQMTLSYSADLAMDASKTNEAQIIQWP
jgi:hypothetical protein